MSGEKEKGGWMSARPKKDKRLRFMPYNVRCGFCLPIGETMNCERRDEEDASGEMGDTDRSLGLSTDFS